MKAAGLQTLQGSAWQECGTTGSRTMGSSLSSPGTPHLHHVVDQGTCSHPHGTRDKTLLSHPVSCTESVPGTAVPHACRTLLPCHLLGTGGGVLQEQSWSSASAVPQLQAAPTALWQCSWLALSQGLRSMGGRPFRGSEAWEMFIAWPQRATRERHRAKAAQATLQSQSPSSKGQSRAGKEKPLLANTQLRKVCLSLKSCSHFYAGQGGWQTQHQCQPCPVGADKGMLGTLVMAGACGTSWKERLSRGQVC